ncbi:MAG: class IV adenylate cyclase [Candidatus Altiarchaeota archaeon]
MLEVEVKARCQDLTEKLDKIGASYVKTEVQEDTYYTHPNRDFRKTDEALRIRRIKDSCYLTYKGPLQDSDTKTREELEYEVSEGVGEILSKLGFMEYRSVRKTRRLYKLEGLEICLDDVEGLGSFIEVESKSLLDKERIFNVLERLGVPRKECTTRTYLDLLEEA